MRPRVAQRPPSAAPSSSSTHSGSTTTATASRTATARAEDAGTPDELERLVGLLGVDRYHARAACARVAARTKAGRAGADNARQQLVLDRVRMVLALAKEEAWQDDGEVLECLQDLVGPDGLEGLLSSKF
jgi:uncharacterized ParB-like nuclease family protein